MYGIYINGEHPLHKKEIATFLAQPQTAAYLSAIELENTAFLNDDYSGPLSRAPRLSKGYYFVGPDPYISRKFYGNLYWDIKSELWKVK